jgi:MFS transporter, DHA1 family, tetracycline resistance protein
MTDGVLNPEETLVQKSAMRRAMFIVFLVVFIDLLGFGIVLPLLPRYADRFMAGFSDDMKGLVIGGLYSSFSLMQFVFSPMWGRVSDRIGRKPILMLGLVGSVVFYGLFAYASSLPAEAWQLAIALLLVSRLGAGIAGASVGTAAAVIADCTSKENRAKGMALIGAAFGFGFTFGPLIAYAALKFFEREPWAPGAVASGLSFVALILGVILLPETLKPGPKERRNFFSVNRTLEVLRTPAVGPLVLIYFLAIFAFANFEGTLALFTKDAFLMAEDDNFLVFAFIGFVLMVVQGGIYRPLAGHRPETMLLKLGLLLMLVGLSGVAVNAIGAFFLTAASGATQGLQPFFYFSVAISVAGFAFVNPSVSALISKRSDPTRQGEVMGVNQSFSALGRILGPFLGSVLFFQSPTRALPFVFAVILLMFVGAIVAIRKDIST